MLLLSLYTISMQGVNKNAKIDPVQTWLDNVAYSHSSSPRTERNYKLHFSQFCKFTGLTADRILMEYEQTTDRAFKRKYAQLLRAWISRLVRQGYTSKSVKTMIATIKSFFKYSDLPLGHVPTARDGVVFHNRDITKEEIVEVLRISNPRDRAFFAVMAQSGLRVDTLCKLRIKHFQPDLLKGRIPLKIEVPKELAKGKYRRYVTFIGEEGVQQLKNYLKTRASLTPESYVFSQHGKEKQLDRRTVSHIFHRMLSKLKAKGILDFKQRELGKPSELRLYNLRKWFRKQAHQAGFEFVQFWMGHIVREGVEESYRPNDPEFHRKLYEEKAMPFLRLELTAPTETEELISKQAKEIEKLKEQLSETIGVKRELSDLKALTKKLIARVEAVEKEQN